MSEYFLGQEELEGIKKRLDSGAGVIDLLPSRDQIPDEFGRDNNQWNRLFSDWFFCGLERLDIHAKDGVDEKLALSCVRGVMNCRDLCHNHKTEAVSYMMSLLFDEDVHWKAKAVEW